MHVEYCYRVAFDETTSTKVVTIEFSNHTKELVIKLYQA